MTTDGWEKLVYVSIVGLWFFVVWLLWGAMAPLINAMPK